MTDDEKKALEKALLAIERLANRRMARLKRWFEREFPKHSLHIIFGMGSESVTVDGYVLHVNAYDDVPSLSRDHYSSGRSAPCLVPIRQALDDISAITRGYTLACPDDVVVRG